MNNRDNSALFLGIGDIYKLCIVGYNINARYTSDRGVFVLSSEYDLLASNLKAAGRALECNGVYGQVLNLNLPYDSRPNGYPARIRVAVGPDLVICRVINTGREHWVFDKAAEPVLDFATEQMRGWNTGSNSCGTGEGKVFWKERSYRPRSINAVNVNYADLLQAVLSARDACVTRSQYRKQGNERWQSEYMDDGVYPVTWTVESDDTEVVIRIKNKGPDSNAFSRLTDWVFGYIERHNSDSSSRPQTRGIMFKVFSDTLRLEVPCR